MVQNSVQVKHISHIQRKIEGPKEIWPMIVVRIAARKRDTWAWLLKPITIYMMSAVDPDARGRVAGFSVCFTVF